MPTSTKCNNPRCTCDPCRCDDCHCNPGKLGKLEERVMETVWRAGSVRPREVAEAMPEYAPTTLATVLRRLANKGLVQRHFEGRVLRYEPVGNAAHHVATVMVDALRSHDELDPSLSSFVSALSESERRALRQVLTHSTP